MEAHHHPENDPAFKALSVNKGISDVPIVNPYQTKKAKRRNFSVAEYVAGIRQGNISVLSQAVTLVESSLPEHQAVAQEVIERCLPFTGSPSDLVLPVFRAPAKAPLSKRWECT